MYFSLYSVVRSNLSMSLVTSFIQISLVLYISMCSHFLSCLVCYLKHARQTSGNFSHFLLTQFSCLSQFIGLKFHSSIPLFHKKIFIDIYYTQIHRTDGSVHSYKYTRICISTKLLSSSFMVVNPYTGLRQSSCRLYYKRANINFLRKVSNYNLNLSYSF